MRSWQLSFGERAFRLLPGSRSSSEPRLQTFPRLPWRLGTSFLVFDMAVFPISSFSVEKKVRSRDTSFKPLLFDVTHRLWGWITLDAVSLNQSTLKSTKSMACRRIV
jgi:hypothetical protein